MTLLNPENLFDVVLKRLREIIGDSAATSPERRILRLRLRNDMVVGAEKSLVGAWSTRDQGLEGRAGRRG